MEPRALTDIEERFDGLVAESAAPTGIDPVCSTTRWIVPAATAFAAQAIPTVFLGDAGAVAMLEHENPKGSVFTSFDCVWGFASPFVGPDPAALIDEVIEHLLPRLDFYALSISGIDPSTPLFAELQRLEPAGYTATAERCVGDLGDGFDAWLERRSSRFRRSLRTAVRDGEAAGIEVDFVSPAAGSDTVRVVDRILDVERRSWKTDVASGLIDTDLGFFTRGMCHRFARTNDLRVGFARLGDRDIGYVVGGIVNDRYRGFQHSFDHDHADLSIGKLLQFHNIERVADEGVRSYDLGMHMAYKDSYSDRLESTITLIVSGDRP